MFLFLFVLSFRFFRRSSVCSLYRLLRSFFFFSLPCSPWWGVLLFCYFVSVLQPPRAACEPGVSEVPLRAVSSLAFLRSCVLGCLVFLFLFSSFPFSVSIWTSIVCFILSCSCRYYAISSVSVSAVTRLARHSLLYNTLISPFLFLSEVYDLFQLLCVLYLLFYLFPPEVIFRCRVVGACLVTTDCILVMS